MGSKPITQRAGTKYGSAPKNQEVTVDAAGTTPAKFERMSPLKQTEIADLVRTNAYSPNYVTVGGAQNVLQDQAEVVDTGIGPRPTSGGISYSNKYSQWDPTAIYPTTSAVNPPEVKTGLKVDDKPEEPKKVSDNPLIQGAADVGKTTSQAVKVDVGSGESFTPMGSGASSSDGQFLGPRERRERMRGVKFSANQKFRQNMADARAEAKELGLSGKAKRDFLSKQRDQFKKDRRSSITAEAERQMNTNQDSLRSKINKRSSETQLSNLKNQIDTQSKLSSLSDNAGTDGLNYKSSAPSLTNKKVGMFSKTTSLASKGQNSKPSTAASNYTFPDMTNQDNIRQFNRMQDFVSATRDLAGTRNMTDTTHFSKTGFYDNFLGNEMKKYNDSPAQKRGYKMGGYGTKNK